MEQRAKTGRKRGVYRKPWVMYVVLFPFVMVLKLYLRTLKLKMSKEDRAMMGEANSPMIILFWHNLLFSIPIIQSRVRKRGRIYGLVSASKDGAWLECVFNYMGLGTIRGSANFRGAQSLKDLIRTIRDGNDVGITPDGSKGPVYTVKPGAAALAKTCKCPIIILSCDHSNAWRLKSWDRFYVPKPFSTVHYRCEWISSYDQLEVEDPHEATRVIESRMREHSGSDT
jgi:lysophospholipid acyltransferase (LPLAT)-like uncharacterized protein